MKIIYGTFLACFLPFLVDAQISPASQWTFVRGDQRLPYTAVYGTIGVADVMNTPGGRRGAAYWTDNTGNAWVYGGERTWFSVYDGACSDLWKYHIATNTWTWVKGNAAVKQRPIYGTQGVANSANTPGSRSNATTWTDANGVLWLLGGISNAPDINIPTNILTGLRNDLWKYDPATNMWTWVKGDTTLGATGAYGTKGVGDVANRPPAREQASSWGDGNGNLWLFGGNGSSVNFSINYNDLWRYNIATNTWTWMKGENTFDQNGTYGTQGTANINNNPPSRAQAASWLDATGKLWLFGGRRGNYNPLEQLNDLWRYDPATNMWTWMKGANTVNQAGQYGTQGTPNTNNRPGARTTPNSWRDAAGDLWLYGGYGIDIGGSYGLLGDLWRYNIAANNWTYMSGHMSVNQRGVYGARAIAAAANKPPCREKAVAFSDATGNFYLFGGNNYNNLGYGASNDIWRYSPVSGQWTWLHGDTAVYLRSVYGTAGVTTTRSQPGIRRSATTFRDTGGNLWLFGGTGNDSLSEGSLNDLWRYNINTNLWTWMKGDRLRDINGVYGTKGTPAAGNKPGSREGATGWTDKSGNFWLFGGRGYSASSYGYLNDLWRYSPATGQWTWINGSNIENRFSTYGTQGTPADANTPGCRMNAVAWTDTSGKLWLFGGYGYANGLLGVDQCADLWRYDIATNQWTFMKGAMMVNEGGAYGNYRIEDAANRPGARSAAAAWTDKNGYLWMQGGEGYGTSFSGYLNDMWRYNPSTNNWTWMNGGQTVNQEEIYGTKGVGDPANRPSGAYNVAFCDTAGHFYMATGYNGYNYNLGVSKLYSRVWRYNTNTNEWTWIKGDTTASVAPNYGIQGVPAPGNDPGGRYQAAGWVDSSGNFWLYSGAGVTNDLWRLGTGTANTAICAGGNTVLRAFVEGATYQWQVNTGSGFANIADGPNYSGSATVALQLTAIPAAWAGYQYRCVVNGLPDAAQGLALTNTWRGGTSDAWENPSNWSCGTVPDANTRVVIGSGTLVIRSNATVKTLRLSPGVNLSVDPGFTLTVLQ